MLRSTRVASVDDETAWPDASDDDPFLTELTPDDPDYDPLRHFDELARYYFDVSGEDFAKNYRAGLYGKTDDWPTDALHIVVGHMPDDGQ